MSTKHAMERATLRLNVLTEQQQILEQLDGYSDCWCKYHQWTSENKANFIKNACKTLGSEGCEAELVHLISRSSRAYGSSDGYYPECLRWDSYYEACLVIKIIPSTLLRIRNSENKAKEVSALIEEAGI